MLNGIREEYSLDRRDTMKESYDIIIKKLERDIQKIDAEIVDIIDKVEYSALYSARYERLRGARDYCKDLIEFFDEVRNNL